MEGDHKLEEFIKLRKKHILGKKLAAVCRQHVEHQTILRTPLIPLKEAKAWKTLIQEKYPNYIVWLEHTIYNKFLDPE